MSSFPRGITVLGLCSHYFIKLCLWHAYYICICITRQSFSLTLSEEFDLRGKHKLMKIVVRKKQILKFCQLFLAHMSILYLMSGIVLWSSAGLFKLCQIRLLCWKWFWPLSRLFTKSSVHKIIWVNDMWSHYGPLVTYCSMMYSFNVTSSLILKCVKNNFR